MKPKAWIDFKDTPNYRRDSFLAGLKRCGYDVQFGKPNHYPQIGDVLLIWNRTGAGEVTAQRFEAAGCKVLCCENGYLGKEFIGRRWYAISYNYHNGAGAWPAGDKWRWNNWNVELQPFKCSGSELVILPQRSIGCSGVAMPRGWEYEASKRVKGRIRPHPGIHPAISLEDDLKNAYAVYTWGSGAALKALLLGVPVYFDMPNWIGALAGANLGDNPNRNDNKRLEMFQRLAWAMWSLEEIEDGSAFQVLL
jgi:hypothetical protein